MKIINDTDLSYGIIGLMIDKIIENGKDDTHYFGQIQVVGMQVQDREIKVQIRYLKRYVEWRFDECVK